MKTTLLSIFTMAIALTQAQPAGLTVVKANAPYNEIKEVQGQLFGYYTYFSQPGIYQIDAATGNETLVGNVPLWVRAEGNLFQTNNFGFINGKVWSLSQKNDGRILWRIDATDIDSIAYFPVSDPILDAEQVKDKAVVFLSRGIWSTNLSVPAVRIDDAVADMANHNVMAFDTIAYYTKFSQTKEYLYSTDGSTVRLLDSCVQVQNNIGLIGYRGGDFYYAVNPGQYNVLTIKKIDTNGNIQTLNTVGTGLYDSGILNNSIMADDYILFRFYQQSPYVQNLYAYNFASSQLVQLTQFTSTQSATITLNKTATNGNVCYVEFRNSATTSDNGTWVSDGTAAGTKFYDDVELKFYDKNAYYDLAHTSIVCGQYPIAGINSGSWATPVKEYYFGNAGGMQLADISPVGNSVPQWFLKHNGAIYFTVYQNFVDMDTQRTNLYRVDDCELAVGINEVGAQVGVSVYPNPSSGTINIETINAEINNIMLLDVRGRVYEVETAKTGTSYTLNAAHLAKGIYVLRLETQHGVSTRRIALQ